jgi:hypothetical protein
LNAQYTDRPYRSGNSKADYHSADKKTNFHSSLFEIENLVLWARSEMIGFTLDQICLGFQVSGVSTYRILNTGLVATERQHR